ncbi:hypothetical protein BJP40_19755 [Streptomyces sp. CC53]|uniref:hypothetical protein n=1 Tax=unclassified Streptomyces TaxID=2593676 RepID=UPI0008DD96F0|nr:MULTISPECIES: hypothetical protein [unclassified Streptomyces]OII64671.1 hypothetical protein BJP40_19755 [Streptomyces sp. CC53]
MRTTPSSGSHPPAERSAPETRPPALIFDDPLEQQSADDTDRGWGDRTPTSSDDLTRFLDEKPPHHL